MGLPVDGCFETDRAPDLTIADVDVLVVGAGPAGLAASTAAAHAGVSVYLADGDLVGGHLVKLSSVDLELYPDVSSGYGLSLALQAEATEAGVEFVPAYVEDVRISGDKFEAVANSYRIVAQTVVVATGRGPGVPDDASYRRWTGRGLTECSSCDAGLAQGGQIVGIVSGPASLREAAAARPYTSRLVFVLAGWAPTSPAELALVDVADLVVEDGAVVMRGDSRLEAVELSSGQTLDASLVIAKDEGVARRPGFVEQLNVPVEIVGHAHSGGVNLGDLLEHASEAGERVAQSVL